MKEKFQQRLEAEIALRPFPQSPEAMQALEDRISALQLAIERFDDYERMIASYMLTFKWIKKEKDRQNLNRDLKMINDLKKNL